MEHTRLPEATATVDEVPVLRAKSRYDPFFVRKCPDRAYALYVRGYTDDTGNIKSETVITVRAGSHPRLVGLSLKQLAAALNDVFYAERNGDLRPVKRNK